MWKILQNFQRSKQGLANPTGRALKASITTHHHHHPTGNPQLRQAL
jgi:hypothetical protein